MDERIRIFSNRTQDIDWQDHNCCQCVKYDEDGMKCDLVTALCKAYWSDGTVSEDEARRMGYFDHEGDYNWRCNEFVRETS